MNDYKENKTIKEIIELIQRSHATISNIIKFHKTDVEFENPGRGVDQRSFLYVKNER